MSILTEIDTDIITVMVMAMDMAILMDTTTKALGKKGGDLKLKNRLVLQQII